MPDTVEPPLFFEGGTEEHVRKVALVTREILAGKTNNTIVGLDLEANATETHIDKARISIDTVATMMPMTQSAATAMAAGVIYFTATKGRLTIHHDSTADTDRTFGVVLVG